MIRLALLVTLLCLLNACGFHLQGQSPLGHSTKLDAANVIFSKPGSLIKPQVLAVMGRYNIRLDKSNTTSATIAAVTFTEHNLSLEAKNQTIERELQARVSVNYDNDQLRSETFTQTAVYTHDPLSVNSSERERQLQREHLLQQLAQQIILRLTQLPSAQ